MSTKTILYELSFLHYYLLFSFDIGLSVGASRGCWVSKKNFGPNHSKAQDGETTVIPIDDFVRITAFGIATRPRHSNSRLIRYASYGM